MLINLIKKNLANYVIQYLPESYVQLQQQIAFHQGHGQIEITKELEENWLRTEQKNQLSQLQTWFDYVLETPTDIYPNWYKYLVLRSLIGLNSNGKKRNQKE